MLKNIQMQKLWWREYADWEHHSEPGRWKPVSVPLSGKSLLSCSSETKNSVDMDHNSMKWYRYHSCFQRVGADGVSTVTGNWYPANMSRTSNRWLKRLLKAFVLFGTKAFYFAGNFIQFSVNYRKRKVWFFYNKCVPGRIINKQRQSAKK